MVCRVTETSSESATQVAQAGAPGAKVRRGSGGAGGQRGAGAGGLWFVAGLGVVAALGLRCRRVSGAVKEAHLSEGDARREDVDLEGTGEASWRVGEGGERVR